MTVATSGATIGWPALRRAAASFSRAPGGSSNTPLALPSSCNRRYISKALSGRSVGFGFKHWSSSACISTVASGHSSHSFLPLT